MYQSSSRSGTATEDWTKSSRKMAYTNDQHPATSVSWRWLMDPALFAAAYFGCAELGHWLTIGPTHIATFWPPGGLYLAVLLRTETRRWPIFLLAALLANGASDVLLHEKSVPVALGTGKRK